jgi:membrane protease YdiL (CAAX protease family)
MEKIPLAPKSSTILVGVLLTLLVVGVLSATGGALILHLFPARPRTAGYYFIGRSLYWLLLLLVWLYAVKVERQPLLIWKDQRFGFGRYVRDIVLIALAILAGVFVAGLVVMLFLHKRESSVPLTEMLVVFRLNPLLMVFTVLTAGVTEELIFRGYLLSRLEWLLKNRYAAILISSILFGLAHYRYGTVKNVVGAFVIGLVLALYYDKYRNIKVTMIFHFLWDLAVVSYAMAHTI